LSVAGKSARAALMAACTSRAAPSTSRDRSNCSVMLAEPTPDCDVISVTPAIVPSRFSSGAATLVAMVVGLAPGSVARTLMVGKSICGSGDTGSTKNAPMPASAMPTVKSNVPMGRRMKMAEMFMRPPALPCGCPRAAPAARTPDRSRAS
jgi:hypothetical protein